MKEKIVIQHFDSFSLREWHDIMALRIAVFVVEQDCPYQDLDGHDPDAVHLFATIDGQVAATLRILKPGVAYACHAIGRVVVGEPYRSTGLGHRIMQEALDYIDREQNGFTVIKLSAQEHLERYYQRHGFEQCGKGYLEDGIPHIPMIRQLT